MLARIAPPTFSDLRAVLHSGRATTKPSGISHERVLSSPILALVTAVCYYIGSQIGFFLTPAETPIAVYWPPNAILLAILLLTPRRIWWVLVVAVLPAHFLIQLRTGIPALSAMGWFLGNVGEALVGAACIRHFQKEKELLFATIRGVVTFLAFGVLLAPLLTSFLDAGSTVLTGLGRGYWTLWVTRLTSNMIANLTIVPTIMTFVSEGIHWFRKVGRTQNFEAALLTAATIVVSFLVFARGNLFDRGPAFVLAPLPLLVWAAVRFGPLGLNFTMLEVTLISVWSAMEGRGIFEHSTMFYRTVSLHILLGLSVLPLLLMATAIAERRSNEEASRGELIYAQEQECHRIAQELHTDIAGRLTLAGFSVDELRASSDAYAKLPLNKLYDEISDIFKAVLHLSHKVYPFGVEYLGLACALIKLCRDTGTQGGMTIKSSVEDVPFNLSLGVSLRIFRVAQIALRDIQERKAKTATVELKVGSGRMLLRITDDGIGMGLQSSKDLGLTYMRQQILSLGGTLKIMPAPCGGVVVEATMPIEVSPDFTHLQSPLVWRRQ